MHISILKPQDAYVKDYYYNKMGGYNIVSPIVVDCNKKFIKLFVIFISM